MKKFSLGLIALAAALAVIPAASASPITGDIIISGFGDTWTSSSISFTPYNTTLFSDGTMATAPNTTPAMSNFTFAPGGAATGVNLYTLPDGETFVIEGIISDSDTATNLTVYGWGYIEEAGFDNTVGLFNLATAMQGTTSYTLDVSVAPEPSSLLLLGTGLLGVGLLMRKGLTS